MSLITKTEMIEVKIKISSHILEELKSIGMTVDRIGRAKCGETTYDPESGSVITSTEYRWGSYIILKKVDEEKSK